MKNFTIHFCFILTFMLLIMGCSSTRVQKYRTRGKIVNEANEPVKGIRITSRNKKHRYYKTGDRGKFTLRVRLNDTLILGISDDQIFQVPIQENKDPVFTISNEDKSLSFNVLASIYGYTVISLSIAALTSAPESYIF